MTDGNDLASALIEAIQTKAALVKKIGEQMAPDVDKGLLSSETVAQHAKARDNFDSALIHLEQGKYHEAVYLFSRGCWNLGEFKGRSDFEKAHPSTPSST